MSVARGFKVGDVVVVERDETRWPSRGSWPRYRGRTGTVVAVNRRDREIGVSWWPGASKDPTRVAVDSWFRPHELQRAPRDPRGARSPQGDVPGGETAEGGS